MADPAALRQRRYRLHKAGDHSMCVLGRCLEVTPPVTRHTTSDLREPTAGLGPAGRNLWSQVTGAGPLGPMQTVLLLEACRIVDRLDALDEQMRGGEYLRLQAPEDEDDDRTFVVVVDKALAEARQQATALRGIVGEIRQAAKPGKPGAGGTEGKGVGRLADLTARIARRDQPAG
jgi:hypothetical protein